MINLETDSIEDSFVTIRLLGEIFDCQTAAEKIIAENKNQLDLIARKVDRIPTHQRLRVMRLMGRDELMTPGGSNQLVSK